MRVASTFTALGAAAALGAVAALPLPAAAHHGWSNYDSDKAMTVTAPVVESSYGHPHGTITVEAEGGRWLVILAPPSRMTNRGLTPEAIAVGETVTVEGYPARNGDKEMRAERITADGKTVELR